jgi:hypothetical protein
MDTVNRFRRARGRRLARQIAALADHLGRDLRILDVGGRARYWQNVGLDRVAEIRLLNADAAELPPVDPPFVNLSGDARAMTGVADGSVDLVHSNSVIEHVGPWPDMAAMAAELRRVGLAGWVQTPAWEFPVEPHFRLPFLHWLGQPARRRLLGLSPLYRGADLASLRHHVDRINLLSRAEVRALFPGCEVSAERLILTKSHIVRWMPTGAPLP